MRRLLRPALRLLRLGWRALTVQAPALASFLASARRSQQQTTWTWQRHDTALPPQVALYVHFDAAGRVAPYVLFSLAELHAAGLAVLFVSNAGRLDPEAVAGVQEHAAAILLRHNVGYDFGAMRAGLEHWQLPRPQTRLILLTNDSVLGPLAPLGPILARLDFAAADVWAAVDSPQRVPHLQSWWLAAGPRALHHPSWRRFWANVRPVRHKEWIIARYELGLTRRLQRAGLRTRALWSYPALLAMAARVPPGATRLRRRQAARIRSMLARGNALNPSADLWRQLLEAGCPFIKRELVTRNPAGVIDAAEWRSAVAPDVLKRLDL